MATSAHRHANPDADGRDGASQSAETHPGATLQVEQPEAEPPRRARRLQSGNVIREAAAALFLEKGYQGTSMDDIAAAARISKQTIYTHFADKETLFADLVLGNVDRVDAFVAGISQTVLEADDVGAGLRRLARQYLRVIVRPEVLQLRRLVIGESGRFPELAKTYYERVPQRVYTALATLLQELTDADRLRVADPVLAAHHFAWLVIGMPMDRGMFYGPDETLTDAELDRIADAAVQAFMAAYGPA
ncbi:MAG TPA: TetR/AcrR family transcriptional regulator [Chloroflexota bacterium]